MSRQRPIRASQTDLESALREAARAVRAGHPEETVMISASALWLLSETLHAQSARIEALKNLQPGKASR
ncbi:hypothetical protein B0G62_10470 [Paraburkholderia eburnea]|uniref:Uncharacterized protein n=1 Tax=Paraburkholderia eburnea TaxID=1189126 RepID=A0A2S4MDD3_9BURK|nr:hypothetical protein [Paraburkholderia eburnea]POR52773.1 hypothetical protein B0G62_10470 [Paraburkholderia eburnea]PRZ23641.1 hypothetical protein BX588_10470 [Paraburkholderia eburnea]